MSRSGVVSGDTIILRVLVTDDEGIPRNSDSLPDVYIYDESVDTGTIQDEIDAATFTSALTGPLTPTLITTGFYELSYTVPGGSTEGTWHDVWVGAIDTVAISSIEVFVVINGGIVDTQTLNYNEMIIVELDESIASTDGSNTLGDDYLLSFATVYKPYYASVELVRMEGGPWMDYIPDDTLALMIHWSSREVDVIAKNHKCTKMWKDARTRFVIYDAALKALTLPGGLFANGLGGDSGDSKRLGELSIKKGDPLKGALSGGVDLETLNYFRKKRDEWWRVVNDGGCIVPGQGLKPTFAVKGRWDPDRRNAGRLWESPDEAHYLVPAANTKIKRGFRRRGRFTHSRHRHRHHRGLHHHNYLYPHNTGEHHKHV